MDLETMYFEKEGRVGRLTLNRPELLNAMNYQGSLDMTRAAEMIRDDSQVRLVLIRGAGRAFCTGIDLKQLAAGETPHQYYENWDRALRILEQAEKILICAMHGYALGGGLAAQQVDEMNDVAVVNEAIHSVHGFGPPTRKGPARDLSLPYIGFESPT